MWEKVMQKIDCQKLRNTVSDAEMRRMLVNILDATYQVGYHDGYKKGFIEAVDEAKEVFGWI